MVVPKVVPSVQPLTSATIEPDLRDCPDQIVSGDSNIHVRVYLCRIVLGLLKTIIKSDSLVVVGGRVEIGPTHEKSLATELRTSAYDVILVDTY